jgi:hypothetical protein
VSGWQLSSNYEELDCFEVVVVVCLSRLWIMDYTIILYSFRPKKILVTLSGYFLIAYM